MSTKARLMKLEWKLTSDDIGLYLRDGSVWIFRGAMGRPSTALDCYVHLQDRIEAGDAEAIRVVTNCSRATPNFGRLIEVLRSTLDTCSENPGAGSEAIH